LVVDLDDLLHHKIVLHRINNPQGNSVLHQNKLEHNKDLSHQEGLHKEDQDLDGPHQEINPLRETTPLLPTPN
jgi:hypothetical protein